MKAETCVVLDTRRPLKSGKYPVKLRVTYARKQQYYPADIEFTKEEFAQITSKSPRGEYKSWKMKLAILEQRASEIINTLPEFDFTVFKRKLYGQRLSATDVYGFYTGYLLTTMLSTKS